VTITDISFNPISITIEKNDYIRWKNQGVLTHTVTSLDPPFDQSIPPNGTYERQFSEIKFIDYKDSNILFQGHINVVNKSEELTYNPDYDRDIIFIINSIYNETTIRMEITQKNFTLNYNDETDGILKLDNNGSYKILNVTLTSSKSWISFDENHFDISSGSTNYVLFKIDPLIIEADETNQTYYIDILAKGINSQEVKETISLFIPYERELETFENLSNEELIRRIKELQDLLSKLNFTFSPDCSATKPYYDTINKKCISEEEVKSRLIQYNYTQEEVASFFLKIGSLDEKLSTISQYQNPILDEIKKNLNENILPFLQLLDRNINKTYELAQQNRDDLERGKALKWIWIIIIGIIVLGGIAVGLIKYKQFIDKKYPN